MPRTKKTTKILKSHKRVAAKKESRLNTQKNVMSENFASFTQKLSSLDNVSTDLRNNKNILNLVLGGLIILLLGVLVFNFANNKQGDLGPAQETANDKTQPAQNKPGEDVAQGNLPGPYTVKEGDTLYLVAEKYYGDGFLFNKIADANKLSDPNLIEVGQTITLPKLEQANTNPNQSSLNAKENTQNTNLVQGGTGGAENQTIWGERITEDTYTIQAGDWLSKISGRAYGDIYAFEKIAKANNLTDPNNIEIGTVIKIPR